MSGFHNFRQSIDFVLHYDEITGMQCLHYSRYLLRIHLFVCTAEKQDGILAIISHLNNGVPAVSIR